MPPVLAVIIKDERLAVPLDYHYVMPMELIIPRQGMIMNSQKQDEPAANPTARTRKTNLEESSIFASRPRSAANKVERGISGTSAWRKWILPGAFVVVFISISL